MNDEEALSYLLDIAHDLQKTIDGLEYEMERIVHDIAGSRDVGDSMSILRERQNAQAGYMYELGKVEARIEDIENRVREQGERETERTADQKWQEEMPAAQEDLLDWLRPALDAPASPQEHDQDDRHHHYEGEERMLEEMQREDREPEDYLDWWKR